MKLGVNANSPSFWFRTKKNMYFLVKQPIPLLLKFFPFYWPFQNTVVPDGERLCPSPGVRTLYKGARAKETWESFMLFFLQGHSLYSERSGLSQIFPSRVLGFQKLTKVRGRPWILFLLAFHNRTISQWIKLNLARGRFIP